MTESITYQSLSQIRTENMRSCLSIARRTKCKPIWALSTALNLQGIEVPYTLRQSSNNHQIAVVKNANARYHIDGVRYVTWGKPLETVAPEEVGTGNGMNDSMGLVVQPEYLGYQLICTSPVCTWAMASTRLSLDELVILGDAMMRRDKRLKRASLSDFITYLQRMRNWSQQHHVRTFRGYDACRHAVRLMCENTDSSQETRTRLALMRHRLDCPEINFPLQIHGQQFYLDMAYPEFHVCVEYDGQFHANQWMGDSRRRRFIENAGWQYVQVTNDDLKNEGTQKNLACRVATAIEKNTGRRISDVCVGLSGSFNTSGRKDSHHKACGRVSNNIKNTHDAHIDGAAVPYSPCRDVRHVIGNDILWIHPLTDWALCDMRYLRSQPRLFRLQK
jgi:very-short-patch-repair endonuclease